MTGTVKQLTVERDQLEFDLRTIREQNDEYKKQINHMEQALEKVRIKVTSLNTYGVFFFKST